jgi:hypothetical protein
LKGFEDSRPQEKSLQNLHHAAKIVALLRSSPHVDERCSTLALHFSNNESGWGAQMADGNLTITLHLSRDEAAAFAELLQRTSYEDCLRKAHSPKRYSDGREEADVMWSALRHVDGQLAGAGAKAKATRT